MRSLLPLLLLASPALAAPDFDGLLEAQNATREADAQGFSELVSAAEEARVEVPLQRVMRSRDALVARTAAAARKPGPAVVLGAARYRGAAQPGALALTMELEVTLGRPDTWKTVPLLGADAVLVSARIEGADIPVHRASGYHVWPTRRVGAVKVIVELLAPATGPRGSIEYAFTTARTPVTRFECTFAGADLDPRIDTAVRSDVAVVDGRTVLSATLSPSTRVRLVGYRELGAVDAPAARAFVEGTGLLSFGRREELFLVLRYTILNGGIARFPVRIPAGYTVESAAAEHGFRHQMEGDVLLGETAEPVEKTFTLSLHLRRALPDGESARIGMPEAIGAERQTGWLAIEAPGPLRLDAREHDGIHAVDVRRLPAELRESAVSPILQAWRFDRPDFTLAVGVRRLVEHRVVPGVIDEVSAFTVVGANGSVLTEVRLMFENRARHRLAVHLPEGGRLRSALLDGNPVGASVDADGRVLLPLIRSGGEADAFELSIVIEHPRPAPGLWGRHTLALPAIELPVSSLRWSVFLPERDSYGALSGEISAQHRAGSARWRRPFDRGDESGEAVAAPRRSQLGASGTMPVRINLPRTGHRINYKRYWVGADHAVQVSTRYARTWLQYPAKAGLTLLLLLALGCVQRRRIFLVPALALAAAVYALVGAVPVVGAAAVVCTVAAWRRDWPRRAARALSAWITGLRATEPRPPVPWTPARLTRVALKVGVALTLLYAARQIIDLAGTLLA